MEMNQDARQASQASEKTPDPIRKKLGVLLVRNTAGKCPRRVNAGVRPSEDEEQRE